MGYNSPPGDEIQQLFGILKDFGRRLSELERPTGSQTAEALATLQALVDGLLTQVNGIFSGYVQAGNYVTAPTGIFPTGVNSVGVYNTILTYGGLYKVQYVHQDGTMGYVPSSLQFKQDVETYWIDLAVLRQLRVVSFRYIAAVENLGDEATREVGLIAEEVHALGIDWLVDYDENGLPFGIKYERLALVTLLWCLYLDSRMELAGLL